MKAKKIFITGLIAVCMLLMTGCGATVELYEQNMGDYRIQNVYISIDSSTKSYIETSAATRPDKLGQRWTITSWLKEFVKHLDPGGGYKYQFVEPGENSYAEYSTVDGKFWYVLTREVPLSALEKPEGEAYGTEEVSANWFMREYKTTKENPFNGVKEDFYNDGSENITQSIKNGVFVDGEKKVVGLLEAFPYLANIINSNPNGADDLNFIYSMDSTKMGYSSGNLVEDYYYSYYEWYTQFGDADTDIWYVFYYARALGWYLVAIGAGLLIVGILLLVYRKKAHKPQSRRTGRGFVYVQQVPPAPKSSPFEEYDAPASSGGKNGGGSGSPFPDYGSSPFPGYDSSPFGEYESGADDKTDENQEKTEEGNNGGEKVGSEDRDDKN